MCHTKHLFNSRRRSALETVTSSEAEARLAALQAKYYALEEECRQLRMEERKTIWKPSWKY